MSGIPVFSAGTSLQSSGASVSAQIPADSAGMLPLFVRVTATAAGYFRLSQDGASASIGDLLIQPSDGLILKTCGLSQFSFVSQSGASTVTVTPIDVGGIKYPTNIFTPAALFTTGVNGAWYDPSDFSTMFQDAAGTTPVTAVGQPVGLMLDKSKGLVLGPELVTNGDFTNGTTGWTLYSLGASITGGALVFDGSTSITAGSGIAVNSVAAPSSGKVYKVTYTIVSDTTQAISTAVNGSTTTARSSAGTYVEYVTAGPTGGVSVVARFVNAPRTGSIDNISVRELPGNHAFNPSGNSANFPVLSARYNLLTKSEDFSDAVWAKTRCSINANAITAPDGTLTADKLIEDSSASTTHAIQSSAQTLPLGDYTGVFYGKAAERTWAVLGIGASTTGIAYFDLLNGLVGTVTGGYTASIQSVGNGWFKCTLTGQAAATLTNPYAIYTATGNNGGSYTGDGTSGIYIWGADLRVSNDALNQPAYQRVNTATDYDTVGFKPYLSFNGVNQWLQTSSVDFTYGDKMFVSAGVRKLSDADTGVIGEFGYGSNGYFVMFAPDSPHQYNVNSKGTVNAGAAVDSGCAAPVTNVASFAGNISAPSLALRINGTQVTQSTATQGTGNFGNYPLYIGARAGTSLFAKINLFGYVMAGKQASASEIASTEAWLNQKTGAY